MQDGEAGESLDRLRGGEEAMLPEYCERGEGGLIHTDLHCVLPHLSFRRVASAPWAAEKPTARTSFLCDWTGFGARSGYLLVW